MIRVLSVLRKQPFIFSVLLCFTILLLSLVGCDCVWGEAEVKGEPLGSLSQWVNRVRQEDNILVTCSFAFRCSSCSVRVIWHPINSSPKWNWDSMIEKARQGCHCLCKFQDCSQCSLSLSSSLVSWSPARTLTPRPARLLHTSPYRIIQHGQKPPPCHCAALSTAQSLLPEIGLTTKGSRLFPQTITNIFKCEMPGTSHQWCQPQSLTQHRLFRMCCHGDDQRSPPRGQDRRHFGVNWLSRGVMHTVQNIKNITHFYFSLTFSVRQSWTSFWESSITTTLPGYISPPFSQIAVIKAFLVHLKTFEHCLCVPPGALKTPCLVFWKMITLEAFNLDPSSILWLRVFSRGTCSRTVTYLIVNLSNGLCVRV